MDKLKQTIKHNINSFGKTLFLVILFFGLTFYMNMATDSFWLQDVGFKSAAIDMCMRNGRPIIAGMYFLGYLFGMSLQTFYCFSAILSVIFLSLGIWLFHKILVKHSLSENLAILLSFEAIANLFIIEYFRFIEKGGFMLAIFLNVLGVYLVERYFSEKKYKYLIYSACVIVLAAFTYQGTLALFVILSLPPVNKYSSKISSYIKNLIFIGAIYLVSAGIVFLAMKFIFNSSRVSSDSNIFDRLSFLNTALTSLLYNPFAMLPKGLLLCLFPVLMLVYLVSVIFNKSLIKRILNSAVLIIVSVCLPIAPIVQGSGWWVMRIVYPLASILGIMAIDYFINSSDDSVYGKKIMDYIIVIFTAIILINQCITNNRIFIDAIKLNDLDRNRINYIGQRIEEYELSTGNTITQIAFYNDSQIDKPHYPDIYFYSRGDNMMDSALYKEWSDIISINYYLNTKYSKVEPDREYFDRFSAEDWHTLSDEQLIFEGNTLHLCLY